MIHATGSDAPIGGGPGQRTSLRLLLQGCAGAFIGVLLAIALARMLLPPDGPAESTPEGLLPWNLPNFRMEPREKGLYLLSLILGPAGAFLATVRIFRGSMPYLCLAVLLALAVPFGNFCAGSTLQGDLSPALGITVATVLTLAFVASLRMWGMDARYEKAAAEKRSPARWQIYLPVLAILALVVVPSSFQQVAARIGTELHVAAFFIGPSLYFLGHGLLPGVDYYTQYGVGLGWIFSFFLGKTIQTTMVHYVILVVAAIWLFYAHLIWVLRWLYQSMFAAAVVSFLALVLLFHSDRVFFDPSSYVLRYPLLTVSAALLARWVAAPQSWAPFLSLALALAAGIFFETETGIVIAIATAAAFVLVSKRPTAGIVSIIGLGAASAVLLVVLLLLVFGKGVLSWQFLSGMIQPLTIYGVVGFGAWPISWKLGEWNWFYNLVAPGVALVTPVIIARAAHAGEVDRPRAALMVFFPACALLMSAKFVNMSLVAVWQMNALGFLIVFGWWTVSLVRSLPGRSGTPPLHAIPVRSVAAALMLLPAAALATTTSEKRNPALYGFHAWLNYPALATAPFHSPDDCSSMECVENLPDPLDVALIRDRTRPGEQVAILGDLYDWTNLVDAHRPPMMALLSAPETFTQHQFDESWKRLAKADYWFLRADAQGTLESDLPEFGVLALPMLQRDFVLDGVGRRLSAWKRKPSGADGKAAD